MQNVEPFGERLLVQPDEPEQVTKSGIYIPPTAQEESQVGTVVAVSKELNDKFKPGETILHSRYGIMKIKVNGKDMLMVNLADVLAKISPAKK